MNQARKRTGTKKVLSMILVLVMLLSLLSMAAFTLPASETGNSKDSYEYNIMFLDCGRKYYSVDSIKQIIDNASAAGFNYIQLAVGNDGLRFLLNDMSLTVGDQTYESNAVEAAIHKGNTDYNATFENNVSKDTGKAYPYSPTTNELTQSEMDEIIAYAQAKGMGVIPCVNTPGHMDAILDAAEELTGKTCSYDGSARTIDVTNSTAVAFTQALLQKYITYFAGKDCKLFNMGADEYANDIYTGGSMGFGNLQRYGKYSYYVTYVNQVAKMIKDAGMKPMAFNDGIYFNGNTSSGKFDTDIIICYWSSGWPGYSPMPASTLDKDMHFKLINTNGSYYWVLGKNDKCDASKASVFDKNSFPGDSKISTPAGSMFCIWSDFPGAETEDEVISGSAATIAAFGAAVTSGTVTPTPTTPTPDTNTSTKDIYVAVNGTETVTVPGTYNGSYTTEDTSIATVTTNATTTKKELKAVTSIESGKQYLIANNRRPNNGKLLTTQTSTWYRNSGLKLTGEASTTSTELWTIQESGSGYEVMRSGKYLMIGENTAYVQSSSAVLTLSYNKNGGYWNISQNSCYLNNLGDSETAGGWKWEDNNAPTDGGSQWTIYEITSGEQTTITFTGKSVGDTSVQIGDVTYTIHVTAEDLSKVTPLKLEYWITNAPIDSVTGADSESRDKVLKSETYKVYFTNIAAKADGVASPDGVDVTRIAPANTSHDNRTVYYWRCRMLDTTLVNNSTTKTQQQTADSGDDETVSGIGFTKIRYYGGNWQVFTENNEWVTVDTEKNQLIAYYLEYIKVSDEVDSYAADWGNRGDGTNGGWLDVNNYCTLSMQVVYEDGTTNPTGTTDKDLKTKTIVYGYWNNNNGRGIGTVLLEGQEYEIYKVTSETGEAEASISRNIDKTYSAEVNKFTWDKNVKTVWEGDPSSSVSIHNDATGFSSEGANANLCWDENHEAILLRVYVRAKVTEDSLTVNYYDESDLSKPFYDYNISVKKGTEFDAGFARTYDGKLVNNTVTNIKNVQQTVQWDLSQLKQIDAQYRYSDYEFTRAERSPDGKTVNLYYTFNWNKAFVVDFGLPVVIRPNDVNENLKNATLTAAEITQSTTYANISVDNDKNITYTLKQTIDGVDNFSVRYMGNITTDTGTQTGHVDYSIKVIPATSVYYEDSFATFTNADKSKGVNKKTDNGYWTTDGKTVTDAKQALEALGGTTNTKNVYGYDPAYAYSSKFSMGSATKVTVNADTSKLGQSPTATFTFTGTGFDVISLTGNQSGTVMYTVKNTKTGDSITNIVNTYYGYKYENGKWVTTSNADPSALYQIPVIKENLTYGTYEVTISVLYGDYFNSTANKWYTFWLDAIRVYNPMGVNNETYKQDNEGYPQYIKLRDSLAKDNTATADAVFIDGGKTAEIATYANYGPNNEVYLANGQAITFTVPENDKIASIQIGAKAPDGRAAQMVVTGVTGGNKLDKELSSATEMYYKIGTAGDSFTITNTGKGILSLTNLKITFKASGQTVTLATLSTEAQKAAVMSVRALFAAPAEPFQPDRFEASWSRNVRKGGTATLTVKASADVEAITVNGEEISAYTTKTARSVWGAKETYHVFTYRVTNAATANYSICAVNGDGVVSDPITAKLTVRPSIRDWWNGIFDKWKH